LLPHLPDPLKDADLKPRQVLDEVPKDDLILERITYLKTMEEYHLSCNREHFRQAASSLCGHGVIHDALTYSGLSPAGDSSLQDEIPPEWATNDHLLHDFLASFVVLAKRRDKGDITGNITA